MGSSELGPIYRRIGHPSSCQPRHTDQVVERRSEEPLFNARSGGVTPRQRCRRCERIAEPEVRIRSPPAASRRTSSPTAEPRVPPQWISSTLIRSTPDGAPSRPFSAPYRLLQGVKGALQSVTWIQYVPEHRRFVNARLHLLFAPRAPVCVRERACLCLARYVAGHAPAFAQFAEAARVQLFRCRRQ